MGINLLPKGNENFLREQGLTLKIMVYFLNCIAVAMR
jgi:hypothetical protein